VEVASALSHAVQGATCSADVVLQTAVYAKQKTGMTLCTAVIVVHGWHLRKTRPTAWRSSVGWMVCPASPFSAATFSSTVTALRQPKYALFVLHTSAHSVSSTGCLTMHGSITTAVAAAAANLGKPRIIRRKKDGRSPWPAPEFSDSMAWEQTANPLEHRL